MARKNTKLWTTKDGQRIRICDMTDTHLLNAIRCVERGHSNAVNAAYCVASSFNPEGMASFYADRDIDRLEQGGPAETCELYEDLVGEADRRGLKR